MSITCNLAGGLGNMLFQIATTLALAFENDNTAVFDLESGTFAHKNPESYKKNIFRNLQIGTFNLSSIFVEPHFHYSKIPYSESMQLEGYFQSEKYFKKYRDRILDIFKPTDEIKKYLQRKYEYILQYNTISVHVRRGDYLKYPDHHPQLDLISYYAKAFEHFPNDSYFLIFSDDIEYCKSQFNIHNEFSRFKKVFIQEDDIDELYLMSMCDHNIIANSSFSWFGAWLNQNPNKKVISPETWFGPAYKDINTVDIIPENWLKII